MAYPVPLKMPGMSGGIAGGPFADPGYWSRQFSRAPYFREGDSYDDFIAAYHVGHGARARYPGRDFASLEAQLRHEWETRKGLSRLDWARAREAVLHAWERCAALPG